MAKAPSKDHVKLVEPVEKPAEPVANAKTDKAFLDAIKEPEKTVRLKVQKGTDEINHEGTSYKVAQGPAAEEWTVDVPPHVAEHILRQGGAVQLDVPPPPIPGVDQGEGFVTVRHVSDPKAVIGHSGKLYEPDESGKLKVPPSIVSDIESHGFVPC